MTHCRSCGASIIWATTEHGVGRMPVDVEPVAGGNLELDELAGHTAVRVVTPEPDVERYVSHFATCPQSAEWRKPA